MLCREVWTWAFYNFITFNAGSRVSQGHFIDAGNSKSPLDVISLEKPLWVSYGVTANKNKLNLKQFWYHIRCLGMHHKEGGGACSWQVATPPVAHKAVSRACRNSTLDSRSHRGLRTEKGSWDPWSSPWEIPTKPRWCPVGCTCRDLGQPPDALEGTAK